MARRSIFNDPSPVNTSDEEVPERQHSDISVTDPESEPETLPPSNEDPQYNSEAPQPSDEDPRSNSEDQDEHSSSSSSSEKGVKKPYRWGSHEDTRLTVKNYYGVLASLDRDHGTSLSNHLYSAHLIKKRNLTVHDSNSDSGENSNSDSDSSVRNKRRQTRGYSPSPLEDGTLPSRSKRFITNSWTSWPHPPSYVPRENEHKTGSLRTQPRKRYYDDDTYDKQLRKGDSAPSQMLEEMLTATFLKLSKEKLRSRPEGEREGMIPVLDDDVSAHVLKPIVRNVISKLDELLMGLYHERRYVKALVEEDEELEKEVLEREAVKKRKLSQYKQTQARKKGQATARKRGVTPMTDTEEDDESAEDEEEELLPKKNVSRTKSSRVRRGPAPPKLAKKYATKRKNRLRPRDWSQVLGIASLTSWDEDTLQRTVRRCEGQFEQTMSWRRLKQDDHIKERKSGEVWTGPRLKHPIGSSSNDEEGISRDGFMMPIKGIGRKKSVLKMSQKKRKKLKARAEKGGV